MSKKNYDADFCGSLPLHKINLIQPHTVLLVLHYPDCSIQQVSENVEKILQKGAPSLIGTPLSDYLSSDQLTDVKKKFETPSSQKLPYTLTIRINGQTREYFALIHRKEDCLLIELQREPGLIRHTAFTTVYLDVKHAIAAMDEAKYVTAVCSMAAAEIQRVSGFDKVMVYRFDRDWNGTVIAEVTEPGMDSYQGLTFPASDNPQQVRNLYLRNPYRLIPDREAQPVGLYPVINPLTQNFLDLSDCDCRAVAGVHLEYLKNMQVMASLSIRIIQNDQLWGLIACHHRTVWPLSFETCAVLEFLSNIISARISSLVNKERFNALGALQEVYARLVEQVYKSNDLLDGLTQHPVTLLDMLRATGAVILSDKKIAVIGAVPSRDEIRDLALWIYSNNITSLYHQDSLPAAYDEALAYAGIASGLLCLPLNPEKREYIMAFRPEVIQSVNRGGNPSGAIQFEADNNHYHPRNSFAVWQQTVQHTAVAWKSYELEMAETFRHFVLEYMVRQHTF